MFFTIGPKSNVALETDEGSNGKFTFSVNLIKGWPPKDTLKEFVLEFSIDDMMTEKSDKVFFEIPQNTPQGIQFIPSGNGLTVIIDKDAAKSFDLTVSTNGDHDSESHEIFGVKMAMSQRHEEWRTNEDTGQTTKVGWLEKSLVWPDKAYGLILNDDGPEQEYYSFPKIDEWRAALDEGYGKKEISDEDKREIEKLIERIDPDTGELRSEGYHEGGEYEDGRQTKFMSEDQGTDEDEFRSDGEELSSFIAEDDAFFGGDGSEEESHFAEWAKRFSDVESEEDAEEMVAELYDVFGDDAEAMLEALGYENFEAA